MGKLIRAIKKFDIFGHPIELNFNKKGSSHKTLIGGVFSIIGLTLWMIFFIITLRRWIIRDSDDFSSQIIPQNYTEMGIVDYKESGTVLFFKI